MSLVAVLTLLILTFCLPLRRDAQAQQYGEQRAVSRVRGTVSSQVDGKALPDVTVTAKGDEGERTTKTDAKGQFLLELSPGAYRVTFSYADYADRTLNLNAEPGKVKEANVSMRKKMAAAAEGVEEMVVTGRNSAMSLDQSRFGESVVDVLSAEDFAVTGDSSVTDALARVTGVTIVDDKYVYVRGLGERYSSTLLNNSLLPSPEPTRRVVPLDLFPSGVMEQLAVEKTYSPSLPADFSGGSLQMTTRAIPADAQGALSITTELNTDTTFRTTPWNGGDSLDWLGVDDGLRHFPDTIQKLSVDNRLPFLEGEDLQTAGLAFNRDYSTTNITIPPNFSADGSYGDSYHMPGGRSVGFLMGGRFENNWQFTNEDRRTTGFDADSKPTPYDRLTEKETVNAIGYAGLGALEWKLNDEHLLRATLFYTKRTDKRFIVDEGFLFENDRNVKDTTWEWENRQLLTAQLIGNHTLWDLGDFGVDWGLTFSRATRDKPDTREYLYERPTDLSRPYVFSQAGAGNRRQWEWLQDDAWDALLNLHQPLTFTENIFTTVNVGAKYFHKDRTSDSRTFRYRPAFTQEDWQNVAVLPIDEIFDDPLIGPGKWEIQETTQFTDSYTAKEEIEAGYIQLDNEFWRDWHWMIGFRYEASNQTSETRAVSGGAPVNSQLEEGFFLPATILAWDFRPDMKARVAFSKTVNRPDLREISPAAYLDPETRNIIIGNPDLQIAEILNYDLGWDWYYGDQDSLGLGFFYKTLKKPIEQTLLLRGAGSSLLRTYNNADKATLWGFELSGRQSLAPLGSWVRNFYCKANASYINSEVSVGDEAALQQTNDKRPLQGQSDWVINGQLTWDDLARDIVATLALNVSGERITDVGVNGLDDAYEQPAPALDFIASHGFQVFGEFMRFEFKAKNLIDPQHVVDRSGIKERNFQTGRNFSFSLEWDF